jgi:hypothetical protein
VGHPACGQIGSARQMVDPMEILPVLLMVLAIAGIPLLSDAPP